MDEIKWNGFLRQRRALLASSIVLAIAHMAGITLEKISFLGNELKVGSPIALNIALWFFWGYWLWRFYTYSRDVRAKDTTLSVYLGKLNSLFPAHVKPIASRILLRDPVFLSTIEDLTHQGDWDILRDKFSCSEIRPIRLSAEGYRFAVLSVVIGYVTKEGNEKTIRIGNAEGVVTHDELRPIKRQAMCYVALHSPVATDFWLPYLVAAVPVVIAATQGVMFLIQKI